MTIYAYFDDTVHAFSTVNIPPVGVDFATFEGVEEIDANALYLKDGDIKLRPPRPQSWLMFDPETEAWVDPRTEADWTAENNASRDKASLSRIDFILHCKQAGILTEEECLIASKGDFPPAFEAIIATMPAEQQFEASVRWAGATVIERNMPLIIDMATAIGVDEWLLDEVFGIPWPAPLGSWPEGQLHPVYTP